MKANINEDEMKLLVYLHENAKGYDQPFKLEPEKVMSDLGIDYPQLQKDVSYLRGHGLVDIEQLQNDADMFAIFGLWITAFGEDFMRELENQPSLPRKITVAILKECERYANRIFFLLSGRVRLAA